SVPYTHYQFALCSSVVPQHIASHVRINFTVDAGCEFARHTGGADWTVAINEVQRCPHRRAARAQSLADWLRFVCLTIGQLRPWIDAEIKALRIKRRWL